MSDIAIRIENLSKMYQIVARTREETLRDQLATWTKSLFVRNGLRRSASARIIWALQDVSLEVKQGEVIGIIGRNGAGKSTLLKILSRITGPDKGRAEIRGRVGSLLEVGTGFHFELSGRENIYLNGAVLGMKKKEIDRKFDEIVAFADIEKFIDTPVKHYSSGMYVRLAFAVAAHLETEILLADEVLSVGDVEFQKKCLGKMGDIAKQGRTVLFVSHNMGTVLTLCPRAILLRFGQLIHDGPSESTIKDYLSNLSATSADAFGDNPERAGNGAVQLVSARVFNEVGQASSHLIAGRSAAFEFRYKNFSSERRGINFMFTIFNNLGIAVSTFDLSHSRKLVDASGQGGVITCHIPDLPLPIGEYRAGALLTVNSEVADWIPNILVFQVDNSNFFSSGRNPPVQLSTCLIRHEWQQGDELEVTPELQATRTQ